MSEATTTTNLPPHAAVNGSTARRYNWQTPNGHHPAGLKQPTAAAGVSGVSQPCQARTHTGCPDRLAATPRRCGCGCHLRAERLAFLFYILAAAAAVIGQVWVAVEHIPWQPGWPTWARVAVVVPFALCLELLGMVTAALADQRMRLGERALGLRVFSAAVAAVAVAVIVVGHWPQAYLVVGFGAFSAAAYLLWTLHAGARRRDALRTAGLLNRVAPAYGWHRWLPLLGRPGWKITHRARELALESGLGLHESLRAAEQEQRQAARRPAIAAAVRTAVKANHPDPVMAEIAVRTLDHDRIATELEQRADYTGWATRLAAAVSATPAPALLGHVDGPDAELDENGAAPGDREIPGAATDPDKASGADTRGPAPRTRTTTSTGARVAEAMARTPKPTKTAVARELGISDRTVRRYTNTHKEQAF